jgi:hypothetical protein
MAMPLRETASAVEETGKSAFTPFIYSPLRAALQCGAVRYTPLITVTLPVGRAASATLTPTTAPYPAHVNLMFIRTSFFPCKRYTVLKSCKKK